ncbi:hypothetical protein E2C01_061319 [Portunus trituberculatus]|uniref:Uncharacterized protein n=1 Tax=Portunus trituberculatus TaxID=210409 RepID=A0A5B7HAM3_PORTR|nr:hypothetical protein [Portunus trituberculatus]
MLCLPYTSTTPQSPFIILFFASQRTNTTCLHTTHLDTPHYRTSPSIPSHLRLPKHCHASQFSTYRLPRSLDA